MLIRFLILIFIATLQITSYAQEVTLQNVPSLNLPNIKDKIEFPKPFSQENPSLTKKAVKTIELPQMDLQGLRQKAFIQDDTKAIKALQFAIPHQIDQEFLQLASQEIVDTEKGQQAIYRLKMSSSNAISLNFGFSQFYLPLSAALHIYSSDGKMLLPPITSRDNDEHGQYWTAIISDKEVIIELNVALEQVQQVRLTLATANQAFLDITNLEKEQAALKSGSCNVDVVCSAGDAWRDQINSVARYTINGSGLCSGALVNNTGSMGRNFLTANHCDVTAASAPSIVVLWNYENDTCRLPGSTSSGQDGNGVFRYFNSGTSYLASYASSDMALVRLDDPIAYRANAYLAGWNRSAAVPSSAVSIHHPAGEEKRISVENDATSITGFISSTGTSHIKVTDWDLGTTEQGSSGAPLFDQASKLIVGQLHGGFAACGNDSADYYGRLAVSWNGGGSPSNRLRDWLDPTNSGVGTQSGRFYNTRYSPDSYEPDNQVTESNELILDGGTQRHSFHNPDDEDWFGFVLSQQTTVDIRTTGAEGDTFMILYNDQGQEVARANDVEGSSFAAINSINLEAGVYFIGVIGVDVYIDNDTFRLEGGAVQSYDIEVRTTPCDFFVIQLPGANKSAMICL